MSIQVEELDDKNRFRLLLTVSYKDLIGFVFSYLKRRSALQFLFLWLCALLLAVSIMIRVRIAGDFSFSRIFFHTLLGGVFLPILCIPVHEFFHVIPYLVTGARRIRIGMDVRQYLFYVYAHRYVTSPLQFWIVGLTPFLVISGGVSTLVVLISGVWKWSLSLFLFVHTTMCSGDFALLNLYFLNRRKMIYTWDDHDKKEAYFYEKIS